VTVRAKIGQALDSTLGAERAARIRSREIAVRRRAAAWLDPRPPSPARRNRPVETPAHLKTPEELAARPVDGWKRPEPVVDHPRAERSRHAFLAQLHELLEPRTYLEIGVNFGKSLALSRTRSIGVDPAFRVEVELHCDLHLVREGSDEFFARPDAVEHFQGVPIDLAFIDGMHLSEFALRDFMNLEKLMSPSGVILIDDVMPRNALEAARDRKTAVWTGDVYKVVDILREQRPDLTVIPVNTSATGTALVLGMDPTSTVLEENYEANLKVCQAGDPQPVPDEVLHRKDAVDVSSLTTSSLWSRLVELRESGDRADVAALLADVRLLLDGSAPS
jgi:predicted O-methyltransferase YrrM